MIIGNGSIAKLLNDREGFVFYAAGISDSGHNGGNVAEEREMNDLCKQLRHSAFNGEMFVYFSTISIFIKQSPYTEHKKNAEDFIKQEFHNYIIIRLGNIWGCTNPHTFINAYKTKPYEPKDEYRYMISKEQLNFITDNLPRTGKHEISIFGELLKVSECLKRIK